MKWFDPLYVSETINPHKDKVIAKIEKGSLFVNAYVITLPSNPQNLFDIISAKELAQKGYPKKDLHIIGIAKDREDAVDLVSLILEESIESGYDTNVLDYLKGLQRQL